MQPVPEIVCLCESFATTYVAQFRSVFKLHIPAICAVGEQYNIKKWIVATVS